jgi:hypothetical protein
MGRYAESVYVLGAAYTMHAESARLTGVQHAPLMEYIFPQGALRCHSSAAHRLKHLSSIVFTGFWAQVLCHLLINTAMAAE